MTLSLQEKIALSDVRIEKARNNLRDAEDTFKEEKYSLAINRAYYAVLSAAKSLLILKGIDAATHEGVKTMLSLHFVKTSYLPRDVVDSFRVLLARRTDIDYGDFSEGTFEEASDSIKKAREFMTLVEQAHARLRNEMT